MANRAERLRGIAEAARASKYAEADADAVHGVEEPYVEDRALPRGFIRFWCDLLLTPGTFFTDFPRRPEFRWFALLIPFAAVFYGLDRYDRTLLRYLMDANPAILFRLNHWSLCLPVALLFGSLALPFFYYIGGWLFDLRVGWSGGRRNRYQARFINFYTAAPYWLAGPLLMLAVRFADPTPLTSLLTNMLIAVSGILFLLKLWSIRIGYTAARHAMNTAKLRSVVWFLLLPGVLATGMFGLLFGMGLIGYMKLTGDELNPLRLLAVLEQDRRITLMDPNLIGPALNRRPAAGAGQGTSLPTWTPAGSAMNLPGYTYGSYPAIELQRAPVEPAEKTRQQIEQAVSRLRAESEMLDSAAEVAVLEEFHARLYLESLLLQSGRLERQDRSDDSRPATGGRGTAYSRLSDFRLRNLGVVPDSGLRHPRFGFQGLFDDATDAVTLLADAMLRQTHIPEEKASLVSTVAQLEELLEQRPNADVLELSPPLVRAMSKTALLRPAESTPLDGIVTRILRQVEAFSKQEPGPLVFERLHKIVNLPVYSSEGNRRFPGVESAWGCIVVNQVAAHLRSTPIGTWIPPVDESGRRNWLLALCHRHTAITAAVRIMDDPPSEFMAMKRHADVRGEPFEVPDEDDRTDQETSSLDRLRDELAEYAAQVKSGIVEPFRERIVVAKESGDHRRVLRLVYGFVTLPCDLLDEKLQAIDDLVAVTDEASFATAQEERTVDLMIAWMKRIAQSGVPAEPDVQKPTTVSLGAPVQSWQEDGPVPLLFISPTDPVVVLYREGLMDRVRHLETGEILVEFQSVSGNFDAWNGGNTGVFSTDGRFFAASSSCDSVQIFDTSTWRRRKVLRPLVRHGVRSIQYLDPENRLAVRCKGNYFLLTEKGELLQHRRNVAPPALGDVNLQAGQIGFATPLMIFSYHDASPLTRIDTWYERRLITWMTHGQRYAFGRREWRRCWRIPVRDASPTLRLPPATVSGLVATHPGGQMAALGRAEPSDINILTLIDTATGQPVRRTAMPQPYRPESIRFTSRGNWIVVTGDEHLHFVSTGDDSVISYPYPKDSEVQTYAVSADDKWLVVSHGDPSRIDVFRLPDVD